MCNIPDHATKITFEYGKGMQGVFHIWRTPQDRWQWHAVGADGEEGTAREALTQARKWITDGYIKQGE
jgi:hypothetical protein